MTRRDERELDKLLDVGPVPEPPAGLAARIAADIPEEIELHPEMALDDDTVVPLGRRRSTWYAAAAAVLTLSLTAAVTWQLRQTGPETATLDVTAAPAGERELRPAQAPPPGTPTATGTEEVAKRPGPEGSAGETGSGQRTGILSRVEGSGQEVRPRHADGDDVAQAPSPQRPRLRTGSASSAEVEAPASAAREKATSGDRDRAERSTFPLGLPDKPPAAKDETTAGAAEGGAPRGDRRRSERQAGTPTLNAEALGRLRSGGYPQGGDTLIVEAVPRSSTATAAVGQDGSTPDLPGSGRIVVRSDDLNVVFAPPSTGGTDEPNDAAYGDVFFAEAGVNPFVDTDDDPLSTFGLEVDTGAYTVVRRFLRDGHLPPREAVRVEELVNAFDYNDRSPRRGDFRLTAEGAPTPFALNDRYRLVRFAVAARNVDAADRPPATLVFVVDVSGSMNRENRLDLVRESLRELLDELRPDDRVGLVVYGSRGEVLLEPTSDLERVRRAIGRLRAGGSTNAEEGLVLGYELAAEHLERGRIARVILCSDGVANVGRTGPASILERIRRDVDRGIELTAVGFGMGNYNDVLMERLADTGDGRYAYVDTLPEARRIFVEELTGTLYTVAREAKAQVEFDPAAVSRWRLLGYENRDIADDRFRDPTVDAGEIGAGHAVTALYEVKLADGARDRDTLATLRVRYRPADSDRPVELEQRLEVGDLAPKWRRASPALRLAAVVAEYAELLKGAYWAKDGSMSAVLAELQRLQPDFAGDGRVADLESLVAAARDLMAEEPPRDRDPDE